MLVSLRTKSRRQIRGGVAGGLREVLHERFACRLREELLQTVLLEQEGRVLPEQDWLQVAFP